VPVNIADLERRASELLPPGAYDYFATGSGHEWTLRASVQAWRRYWLAPRVLRDVSAVDTSVRLPGHPQTVAATPVAVAPMGFQGLAHPDGELATARGAAKAGALMVLSTRTTCRIEEVAQVVAGAGGAWWFQVYLMRDRDLTARLVDRAVAAGARALVLTGDTPVVGHKLRGDGVVSDALLDANLGPLADPSMTGQAAHVTFADIGWLARRSGLPVLVKGVLRADDARACLAAGAAGIIVSNHGGRQLDRAIPTALALPAVVAALARDDVTAAEKGTGGAADDNAGTGGEDAGTGGEVLVDGGLRSGEDVLTALALGARAVFLGRPVLWALACDGAAGVRDLLTGITDDLAHVMALAGARSVAEIPEVTGPLTSNSLDM
jgi:4-hydroxymandelate oxidase